MQEFREILETDTVSDSRETINKGLQTLRSNFAGEAFPTENLAVGMKCYRTDRGRTYTLKSLDPLEWEEDGSAVKREDMTNSQLFTEAMTREALKNVTDWSHFFSRLPVMEFLDLTPYPIDQATKLEYLFANDFMLKAISGFEIGGGKVFAEGWHRSLVKSVEGMFYRCESLSVFDAETINTRGTENFKDMFAFCRRLEKLLVEHWDMNECRTMAGMFKGCEKLSDIDVSKWDVSNAEDFSSMFEGCKSFAGIIRWDREILTNVPNVDGWTTTKAKHMGRMFKGCEFIRELDLSKFDMRNVESVQGMFQNCFNLQRIVCGEHTFSTGNVKDFSRMFDSCGLQSFGKYNAENLPNGWKEDMTVLSKMNFSSAENMEAMLRNTCLRNVEAYVQGNDLFDTCWLDFAEHTLWSEKYTMRGLHLKIDAPNARNISSMFSGYRMHGIHLEMDTSKVENMRLLFADCSAVFIRLKGFATANSLRSFPLGHGMDHMFRGCRRLRFLIIDSTEFKFELKYPEPYDAERKDVLADLPTECRILVPKALLPTYRQAPVWRNYEDRLSAIEGYDFCYGDGYTLFIRNRRPIAVEPLRMQDAVTFRKV